VNQSAINLIQKDLETVWHPCSQMKDYESFKPLLVESAKGSYITLSDGTKIIDAISSWWCKTLGHNHSRLKQALIKQTKKFEHVILANTTNKTLVDFSEKITSLLPSLNKITFASDGSCAVEIALKLSLHAQIIKGNSKKNKFISLANSYHGETAATLSVSDVGIFKDNYKKILFNTLSIQDMPYVNGLKDPLWNNCDQYWQKIILFLENHKNNLAAIIVEPIVQGAGGMKIYSQDLLRKIRKWTQENDVYLIADEILTGLGRTGKMLACQHADIEPDFLCLSKGLTAGWIPCSVTLTTNSIYELFYDDYEKGKNFLHSHTHSGNALALAVASETLSILQEQSYCNRAQILEIKMREAFQEISDNTKKIENIRAIGGIVAADLICPKNTRTGYEIYKIAIKKGALLRPLGNTIYWLPPLNIQDKTLKNLRHITQQAIMDVLN
jgi:adenosylmethionine---8-amino-7-oxononanoate aminotransferase